MTFLSLVLLVVVVVFVKDVSSASSSGAGDASANPVLFATLNLVEGSDTQKTCLDSVPLNTCLHGTKYSYSSQQQQYVNVSIFRHVAAAAHQPCAVTSTVAPRIMTITVPIGIPFSLRQFHSHHNRQHAGHGAKDQLRNHLFDHESEIDREDFLHFQNFGRGVTSLSLFGSTPYDEDSIVIEQCSTVSCTFRTASSRHRSFSSSSSFSSTLTTTATTTADSEKKNTDPGVSHVPLSSSSSSSSSSPLSGSTTIFFSSSTNVQHELGGLGMYCVGLKSEGVFAQANIILKEVYSSNDECLKSSALLLSSSSSSSSSRLIWQLFRVGEILSVPLYSIIFYEREHRIISGNKIEIVGVNGKEVHDQEQEQEQEQGEGEAAKTNKSSSLSFCLQSSYLTSLYCHSCGGQKRPHHLDEQHGALLLSSDHEDSPFYAHRWGGPCPLRTLDSTQRVGRQLNYEIDPICRPATCVNFVIYENKRDCLLGERRGGAAKERGKLLTLPCGSYHDRDSTGGLMHNVFLSCNTKMDRFHLYGECDGEWCKSYFSLLGGSWKSDDGEGDAFVEGNVSERKQEEKARDDKEDGKKTHKKLESGAAAPAADAATCVKVNSRLLTNSGMKLLDDVNHAFFVSVVETGVECSTFGIKALRTRDESNVVMDIDRFVSQSCIPLRAGDEPKMEPVCVNWKRDININVNSINGSNNNNNNNRKSKSGETPSSGRTSKDVKLHLEVEIPHGIEQGWKEFEHKLLNLMYAGQNVNTTGVNTRARNPSLLSSSPRNFDVSSSISSSTAAMLFLTQLRTKHEKVFGKYHTEEYSHGRRQHSGATIFITITFNGSSSTSSRSSWNDLATINSFTQIQLRSLGIVSLAFEGWSSISIEENQKSNYNNNRENGVSSSDSVVVDSIPRFILPKSFRKSEIDYAKDENTNAQGPIPTRGGRERERRRRKWTKTNDDVVGSSSNSNVQDETGYVKFKRTLASNVYARRQDEQESARVLLDSWFVTVSVLVFVVIFIVASYMMNRRRKGTIANFRSRKM